jgi:23S rRNA pseudouridine1911/1915/1917 synthase
MDNFFNVIISKEEQKLTLRELLTSFGLAKSKQYLLFEHKACYINGIVAGPEIVLHYQDYVSIDVSEYEKIDYPSYPENIQVLYEDEYLLAVNKKRDCIIYPEKKEYAHTMANLVANYYEKTNQIHTIRHVHRLDRDTTGCLLYAKDMITESMLSKMFEDNEVKKTYLAVVEGIVNPQGTIETGIGRDRHNSGKMIVSKEGKRSITHYQLKKRIGLTHSLVEITIETGRTHQIRLHLSSIGHPLVGDAMYGTITDTKKNLMLHCSEISFVHPVTHQNIVIKADMPDEMKKEIELEE